MPVSQSMKPWPLFLVFVSCCPLLASADPPDEASVRFPLHVLWWWAPLSFSIPLPGVETSKKRKTWSWICSRHLKKKKEKKTHLKQIQVVEQFLNVFIANDLPGYSWQLCRQVERVGKSYMASVETPHPHVSWLRLPLICCRTCQLHLTRIQIHGSPWCVFLGQLYLPAPVLTAVRHPSQLRNHKWHQRQVNQNNTEVSHRMYNSAHPGTQSGWCDNSMMQYALRLFRKLSSHRSQTHGLSIHTVCWPVKN